MTSLHCSKICLTLEGSRVRMLTPCYCKFYGKIAFGYKDCSQFVTKATLAQVLRSRKTVFGPANRHPIVRLRIGAKFPGVIPKVVKLHTIFFSVCRIVQVCLKHPASNVLFFFSVSGIQ